MILQKQSEVTPNDIPSKLYKPALLFIIKAPVFQRTPSMTWVLGASSKFLHLILAKRPSSGYQLRIPEGGRGHGVLRWCFNEPFWGGALNIRINAACGKGSLLKATGQVWKEFILQEPGAVLGRKCQKPGTARDAGCACSRHSQYSYFQFENIGIVKQLLFTINIPVVPRKPFLLKSPRFFLFLTFLIIEKQHMLKEVRGGERLTT